MPLCECPPHPPNRDVICLGRRASSLRPGRSAWYKVGTGGATEEADECLSSFLLCSPYPGSCVQQHACSTCSTAAPSRAGRVGCRSGAHRPILQRLTVLASQLNRHTFVSHGPRVWEVRDEAACGYGYVRAPSVACGRPSSCCVLTWWGECTSL